MLYSDEEHEVCIIKAGQLHCKTYVTYVLTYANMNFQDRIQNKAFREN